MDLLSQSELELYFADHLDTSLYTLLAESYLKSDDLTRARKVCQVGLKQHPNDEDGWYILSTIARREDDLINAEKCLKEALDCGRSHVRARIELAEIQTQLQRSPNTIISSWKRVLRLIPDHPKATAEIERLKAEKTQAASPPKPEKETSPRQKKAQPKVRSKPEPPQSAAAKFGPPVTPVSPRMATMTLAQVYKDQGLYQHALDVLELLEKKGVNPKAVAEEKETVKRLLQQSLEEKIS